MVPLPPPLLSQQYIPRFDPVVTGSPVTPLAPQAQAQQQSPSPSQAQAQAQQAPPLPAGIP
ncbi:hypothetical protein KEM52_002842, partial [Ascosphaera acerosa]